MMGSAHMGTAMFLNDSNRISASKEANRVIKPVINEKARD